jgi:hypothetical protein
MRLGKWLPFLGLFLAAPGRATAEPIKGVVGRPARITPFFLPEVTMAVFGPQENPKCLDGRIVFGAGKFIQTATLDGVAVALQDLNLLTGESTSSPIWDSHLIRVGDDLVHTVEGQTYADLPCRSGSPPCPHPKWWNTFTEYPAKGKNTPGAREAIWVFRSSDCGDTWSLSGKIDAATLTVKTPKEGSVKGFCGVPRPWEEVACSDPTKKDIKDCPASTVPTKKWAEVGGWDGHYIAAEPEGRMVVSTLCAFGTGTSQRPAPGVTDSTFLLKNNDLRAHIFVVSDDGGKSWQSQASLPQPDKERPSLGIWRGAIMPLDGDRWAFAYGLDGKVKLLIDDPLKGSFSKTTAVADFQEVTKTDPLPWNLFTNHFAIGWDLALNRVPIGSTAGPGGLKRPIFKPLVQVASYTWDKGSTLRFQTHNVDLDTGIAKALTSAIRADDDGDSVAEGSFIQGHRASLFYWLEELEANKFRVRYQIYSQGKPLLTAGLFSRQKPGTVKDTGGQPHEFTGLGTGSTVPFQGDYVKGAHYLDTKENEHFFLVWNENGTVAFAEVRVIGLNDLPLK